MMMVDSQIFPNIATWLPSMEKVQDQMELSILKEEKANYKLQDDNAEFYVVVATVVLAVTTVVLAVIQAVTVIA